MELSPMVSTEIPISSRVFALQRPHCDLPALPRFVIRTQVFLSMFSNMYGNIPDFTTHRGWDWCPFSGICFTSPSNIYWKLIPTSWKMLNWEIYRMVNERNYGTSPFLVGKSTIFQVGIPQIPALQGGDPSYAAGALRPGHLRIGLGDGPLVDPWVESVLWS